MKQRRLGVRVGLTGALWVGLVTLTGCSNGADTHPGQPVTHRQVIFKKMLRTLEPMGLVVRGRNDYDPAQFTQLADQLKTLSTQPWPYFTPDSNYPPTRAKSEVWSKPADFRAAQQKFIDAVAALDVAAKQNQLDAVKAPFAAVEASCKSCHQQFRGVPH